VGFRELTTKHATALIDAEDLHHQIGDRGVRVADVRWYIGRPGAGRAAYDAGHIPGAIFVDLDTDLVEPGGFGAPGRHPLPDPSTFAQRMADLGLRDDDLVVAYDDAGGSIAARLWWMLDSLEHRGGVAVLDGGLPAWTRAGFGLSTETTQTAVSDARPLDLAQEWPRVIDRHELAQRLGEVTLLDVRAGERYRGEVEPIDPRAGHIPTALSAPTTASLHGDGRMRPPDELRRQFDAILNRDQPVVVSCGSGVTACHTALALRLAGRHDPILYVGSFSDWSRSDLPVATGPGPGSPEEVH
jgi:thiosulfate/3-mercaptopyruvate sulfurtransferase